MVPLQQRAQGSHVAKAEAEAGRSLAAIAAGGARRTARWENQEHALGEPSSPIGPAIRPPPSQATARPPKKPKSANARAVSSRSPSAMHESLPWPRFASQCQPRRLCVVGGRIPSIGKPGPAGSTSSSLFRLLGKLRGHVLSRHLLCWSCRV